MKSICSFFLGLAPVCKYTSPFCLWFTNHLLNNWLQDPPSETMSFPRELCTYGDISVKTSWK